MKPYTPVNAMFWRPDPAIDELRQRDGWAEFHRAAGKRGLYFDLTVKEARRYKNTVFTLKKSTSKTPLDEFEAAYAATGRGDAELDALVARIRGEAPPPSVEIVEVVEDDFDGLFDEDVEPVSSVDEFEDLFG